MQAYQLTAAGLFLGITEADESPLEPGVYHMPAGCIATPPPETWPDDKWPRWNGSAWQLVNKPTAPAEPSAVEKLAAFLEANPDVAALVDTPEPV